MKDIGEILFSRQWNFNAADMVLHDQEFFNEAYDAFFNGNGHVSHRSGFILTKVFKAKPELLLPRIPELLEKMPDPPNEWYRWFVIYDLSHCNYPAEYDGLAATYAFEELGKSYAKPAAKNACMRLLEFICKRNPELIPEFKLYLDDIIENERPTLAAKAKKQLGTLKKFEQ